MSNARLVGGMLFEGEESCLLQPSVGETHYWRIMKSLALVKNVGRTPVESIIRREQRIFKGKSLVVVVTATPTDGLAECLSYINKQGITAALVSPASSRLEEKLERYDAARS